MAFEANEYMFQKLLGQTCGMTYTVLLTGSLPADASARRAGEVTDLFTCYRSST